MRLLAKLLAYIRGGEVEGSEITTMRSVGVPPITRHDGTMSRITLTYNSTLNHLQQNHVIDNEFNIQVVLKGWPKRDQHEEPAMMTLWVRNKDHIPKAVTFIDPLEWWNESGPIEFIPTYTDTQPVYRFWSWGDGRVFASLVPPAFTV